MRKTLVGTLILAAAVLLGTAAAQAVPIAIHGYVQDWRRNPVANYPASLSVGSGSCAGYTAYTNSNGYFEFQLDEGCFGSYWVNVGTASRQVNVTCNCHYDVGTFVLPRPPCGRPPCVYEKGDDDMPEVDGADLGDDDMPNSVPTPVTITAVAFPNPLRSSTTISFSSPAGEGRVDAQIFDVSGRLVRAFNGVALAAGPSDFSWDARDSRGQHVQPGFYFLRLASPRDQKFIRLIVLN